MSSNFEKVVYLLRKSTVYLSKLTYNFEHEWVYDEHMALCFLFLEDARHCAQNDLAKWDIVIIKYTSKVEVVEELLKELV